MSQYREERNSVMAEKSYPQIPAAVWWGVRGLLQRSPNAKYDAAMLGASINVQESAAKAYLRQLVSVGILDDEGKLTDIGGKWRLDESYEEAVDEIVAKNYDEALVAICPPGSVDRSVAKKWFMAQGLGEGSAGNKAATYELISSPEVGSIEPKSSGSSRETKNPSSARNNKSTKRPKSNGAKVDDVPNDNNNGIVRPEAFPLNVNIQIHISADATSDQIDSIFKSMRQHLHD